MKNDIDANAAETIEIYISQIEFLHETSVQQGEKNRHIADALITDVIQKIKDHPLFSRGNNPDSCNRSVCVYGTSALTVTTESTIGTRIHELRKELALTQKQIAERVGVTSSCVTQWESDLNTPNCDKLIPLANALGCDPLWLLGVQ